MRNSVSFYKQYCRRLALSSLLCLAALGVLPAAQTVQFIAPGEPSVPLAKLFTPRHAPAGAFEVRVLPVGIGRARQLALAAAGAGPGAAAAHPVIELDPLDAFGQAGDYDQTTVARLYTGRKAQVVRIPIERDGRTVAAVTLVSPYPDATLSRLEEGTMVIVLHLGSRSE